METVLVQYIDNFTFSEMVSATLKGGDITILLDCYGGDLCAGWKMYDLLHNYEGNVYVNVIGACMSAANLVLFSTPLENRRCNEHAEFLIHKPLLDWYGALTQKDIKEIDKVINSEQKKLVDLYHTELKASDAVLDALVDNEQVIDANFALKLGFVGSVNASHKVSDQVQNCINAVLRMKSRKQVKNDMENNKTLLEKLVNLIKEVKNEVELTVTDANGNEVKVNAAGDVPAVGDKVDAPDGALLMADGSTWVIEGGVIKAIEPAQTEEETEEPEVENECEEDDKDKKIADLEAKIKALEEEAQTAEEEEKKKEEEIENLKNKVSSLDEIVATINALGGVEGLKNIVSEQPATKSEDWRNKPVNEMTHEEKRRLVFGK